QYRYTDGQPPAITGYQATNTVSVRFRDVARSGTVLDTLVAEGANQIEGPNLSIDKPDAALDEARTDAVKRARARADLYASAAGMR
ncbi:SIMPL domain-containing protein, partial [Escherichia coli]